MENPPKEDGKCAGGARKHFKILHAKRPYEQLNSALIKLR